MIAIAFQTSAQDKANWLTDMDAAQKEAVYANKNILVSFSGSDWCGNCIRLDKDLFQTAKFLDFADKNLVLLNLDFPAKKANKLSVAQTSHNDKWAEVFNKDGIFPLTILIDKKGEKIAQLTYPSATLEAYINNLTAINK